MLIPAIILQSSPATWPGVPLPADAMFILPGLALALRQPLTDQACRYVGYAAGRKADNDAHCPRRIGLGPRDARHGREHSSTRRQMKKSTAWKFHGVAPLIR